MAEGVGFARAVRAAMTVYFCHAILARMWGQTLGDAYLEAIFWRAALAFYLWVS